MAEKDDLWAETGDDPIPETWKRSGPANWTESIGQAIASHLGQLEQSGWLQELERQAKEESGDKKVHKKEVRMLAGLAGLKGKEVAERLAMEEFDYGTRPVEDRWLLELPPESDD